MLPSFVTIISFVMAAILLTIIVYILPSKLGIFVEITLGLLITVYLFVVYPTGAAFIIFSLSSTAYANLSTLLNQDKRRVRQSLQKKLSEHIYETVHCTRNIKRLWLDISIVILVSSLALVFLIWAPEPYIILKFIIMISMITVVVQLVGRLGNYFTTAIYWLPESGRLMIISLFESREFPAEDLEKVMIESEPDILRLHPLFSFLAQRQDYTTSLGPVLRLDLPGEHIYFSPTDAQYWHSIFAQYMSEKAHDDIKEIIPLWHLDNVKRLIWKGYFAITVKGISAYTGLLLILIFLKVPPIGMIITITLWWLFNLYVSDRVLVAGTDATLVTDGKLYEMVEKLSRKADIKRPNIYTIDSPIYNGLATGMNIGRGTIMVTTATMKLPIQSIEAIIAHEISHVKKHDVLVNQLARVLFFAVLGSSIYLFYDEIVQLAERPFLLFISVYILMMLFPLYFSFVSQYCEIRADYLASKILQDGQMASGLADLGKAQEEATQKTLKYSHSDVGEQQKNRGILQRGPWWMRVIEYQLMPHPPLYFRMYCLQKNLSWRKTLFAWFKARITESLPDLFGRENKYDSSA